MARAPSEKVNKALLLYQQGYKLIDIAKELDIPDGTVRRWKKTYNWDNERSDNESERSEKKKRDIKTTKEYVEDEVKELLSNTSLTDKQRLFCIYYVKCFNATKAAIKAGYSKNRASELGYQLLQKPTVQSEIQLLKQNKFNRAMLSEDDIFQRYIDIAFSDITDYLDFGSEEVEGEFGTYTRNYINLKNSYEIDGALISEVSQGKDGIKIKLQDKMKALNWLSERMDLLPKITLEKLELEKSKLELARIKAGTNEDEEEFEDDGFMDAIKSSVSEVVWTDEEID